MLVRRRYWALRFSKALRPLTGPMGEEPSAKAMMWCQTEEVQAAEVGRIFSGAFSPFKSVVPSPVHQTVVTAGHHSADSDQKSTLFARLGQLPEHEEQ